jgi:hypothetical protein
MFIPTPAGAAPRVPVQFPAFSALLAVALGATTPALANNYGESLAWQFQSPADRASQAAVLDLIERRRGGVYAAPIYTTNIARQVNCSISAVATGNSGAQTALANSPTTNGATSAATGNSNTSSIGDGRSNADVANGQANSGPVASSVIGATTSTVSGTAWQALNSDQTNSGDQTADVGGSTACTFGALN